MAPVTGTYTFTTTSDDGVRLYVNGQLLIDNWTDHRGRTEQRDASSLAAGQRYDIRMDYYDHATLATARLSWAYPGQTHSGRAAMGAVSRAAGQSAAGRERGRRPDDQSAGCGRRSTGIARRRRAAESGNLTTTWSKISGREDSDGGTVVFANPNAPATTATFGADGIYVLRLTVSDGAVTVSDDVTITVNPPPSSAPEPDCSASTSTIRTTARISSRCVRGRLDATVNFDWASGAPGDRRDRRTTSRCGGPGRCRRRSSGNYTFTTIGRRRRAPVGQRAALIDNWVDQAVTTRASAPIALVGRLAATTSRWSTTSTAGWRRRGCCGRIRGRRRSRFRKSQLYPPANRAPAVNAGADRTITLPATATLAGTATDDGLPSPPAQLSTAWSRVSGPGTVTFANASA